MITIREILFQYMLDNIHEFYSVDSMVEHTLAEYPDVIHADTFIWNDAQNIWDNTQEQKVINKYG